MDRAHIERDIFSSRAVATRDAALELALVISHRERHAIELQLAHVIDFAAPGKIVNPALPCAKLLLVISVVERQHGRGVADFPESFARLAADALRGRVGSDQLRMLGLEILQLLHQLVEFEVADLRLVEDVIEMFVMANRVAQRFDLGGSIFNGRHRGNYNDSRTAPHGVQAKRSEPALDQVF